MSFVGDEQKETKDVTASHFHAHAAASACLLWIYANLQSFYQASHGHDFLLILLGERPTPACGINCVPISAFTTFLQARTFRLECFSNNYFWFLQEALGTCVKEKFAFVFFMLSERGSSPVKLLPRISSGLRFEASRASFDNERKPLWAWSKRVEKLFEENSFRRKML